MIKPMFSSTQQICCHTFQASSLDLAVPPSVLALVDELEVPGCGVGVSIGSSQDMHCIDRALLEAGDSLNKAFASTSTVRTEKSEKSYADVSEKLAASQARQPNPERLHLSQ